MSILDTPVILEAAINGMTTKEKNPNSPCSPEEIERDALLAYEHLVADGANRLFLPPDVARDQA